MRLTLESTTTLVTLEKDGHEMPARVWEGHTAAGVPVHVFITRIAVDRNDDLGTFEDELLAQDAPRAPRNPDIAAYPVRLIL